MIARPDQARILKEFGNAYLPVGDARGLSAQKMSKEHVVALLQTIKDMGNLFKEDTPELLTLDIYNAMDESWQRTIQQLPQVDLLLTSHAPCMTQKTQWLSSDVLHHSPRPSRQDSYNNDVALFSRQYIVMQHRDCDMSTNTKITQALPLCVTVAGYAWRRSLIC